jgi:hypothetical protein
VRSADGLPDGLVCFVKAECETSQMVVPVLQALRSNGTRLTVYTQDDPSFPPGVDPIDDTSLERSYRQQIEIVPTLYRVESGQIIGSIQGWDRQGWQQLTGRSGLGDGLPSTRPGCGSRTLDPDMVDVLRARFGAARLRSRRVQVAPLEDPVEAMFERGWSDGLPLVPPTPERVVRMLEGTRRDPQDVVALVPPDLQPCTVEKVAVNAVMAGCLPEYLPVVLAAVEAVCTDAFNIHGVLATTWFSGPLIVVNGPIARRIGMNSGINALGQGNRANATIGRALQLVIRNVGGGRPGGIDRATLGQPGKYTFCFAEAEATSPWEPLSVERGFPGSASTVTVFAAAGVQPVFDQLSRTPESLARTLAECLKVVGHPKWGMAWDALCVISPEHARIFREAGWSKDRLRQEIQRTLTRPGSELVKGAGGMAEGMPESFIEAAVPKFRPGGLLFVHAGGTAGLFSAIIGGWVSGEAGSEAVTREILD